MDEDWDRVRLAVEARMNELRMNRTHLAAAAGVDIKTVKNFLDNGRRPQSSKQRGGYEAALRWTFGSLTTIARGGVPEPLPSEEDSAESPRSVGPTDDDAQYVADDTGKPGIAGISDEELADRIRAGLEAMDEMRRRTERSGRPVDGAR